MDLSVHAQELCSQGRFSEARAAISGLSPAKSDPATSLLKATVFEMTGELPEAERAAGQVLRSRVITDSQRSVAELVLSRVASERGELDTALKHLQKATAMAARAEDPGLVAWAQLKELGYLANRNGPAACQKLMAKLRHNVACAGDPVLTVAMHLLVADADGKHGLLVKCRRHVRIALSLLQKYPNLWLSGWAENTLLALAIVECDIPSAVAHGAKALELGRASGSHIILTSAIGNMGRLEFVRGNFDLALTHLREALESSPPNSDRADGVRDSIARVYMAQGRLDDAEPLLGHAAISDRSSPRTGGYVHRHSLLTKAEILARQGRFDAAQAHFSETIALAEKCEDTILEDNARNLSEEIARIAGRRPSPTQAPVAVIPRQTTPEGTLYYERTLMAELASSGSIRAAERHRDRALRLCRAITNKPGELEVIRLWKLLVSQFCTNANESERVGAEAVHNVAALLLHARRVELVASGILATIENTDCAVGARAISRAADGSEAVLDSFGTIDGQTPARTFPVGTTPERTVEVQIHARPDIESNATISSVGLIIHTARELDRARLDREERLTLWPVEELPAEDDDSVVSGTMSAVMLAARKIADTRCAVLITGESGTGKELVARAVHRYSSRALKPFIPFNCTAVPRDLMESHLFGYRRGAFTGADRDNPGLIRSAQGGTLFLDEVGDLSLELQPKLLRFLESTEIHPLGDGVPFPVNVRIVAATNANLRQLVEQGRFREDLYYRLNVFPIELPPLRKRREEIAPLAQTFALKWSHELGKGCVRIAPDLMAHFELYSWPGNIRQLNHEVNRLMATAEPNQDLTADMLSPQMRDETEQAKRKASGLEMTISLTDPLEATIARIEEEMIRIALTRNHGKVEAAAKALGISRKGLYLKRQRLGL